jgi:ribose-phosphate pyrophosphokinase
MTGVQAEYAESFALSVFSKILNTFRFKHVFCIDPHSTVTNDNMIDGLKALSNLQYIQRAAQAGDEVDFLVAPDEGAIKKTLNYSLALKIPYIISFKRRNVLTGKIEGVNLPKEEGEKITGKTVLISDDICVGGMTFLELAKELRKYNPKKIKLFVTHGIFNKGTTLESIDEIFCTNSCRNLIDTPSFTQFNLVIPDV